MRLCVGKTVGQHHARSTPAAGNNNRIGALKRTIGHVQREALAFAAVRRRRLHLSNRAPTALLNTQDTRRAAQHVKHRGSLVGKRVKAPFGFFAPFQPQAGEKRLNGIGVKSCRGSFFA